jgi:hypothetical protein
MARRFFYPSQKFTLEGIELRTWRYYSEALTITLEALPLENR